VWGFAHARTAVPRVHSYIDEINRTEASTLATDERTTVESSPVLEPITPFVRLDLDPTRETDTPNLVCGGAAP
jgi:hypothetical protein